MIIVEFEVDSPILRETRRAVPGTTITLEAEQAPDGTDGDSHDSIHLLFWASGGEFDDFESALAADPTVTSPRLLADADGSRLYRVLYTDEGMRWTAHREWVDLDATLLHAEAVEDGWAVRMRFPDRESVVEFKSWFDERDLPFETNSLYTEGASGPELGPKLTDAQREALLLAWERGYFEVPRGTDLMALAAELGLSDSAVSQRLRRGIDRILTYEFRIRSSRRNP